MVEKEEKKKNNMKRKDAYINRTVHHFLRTQNKVY